MRGRVVSSIPTAGEGARQILDLAGFILYLCEEFELAPDAVRPETRFVEDLDFDSLRMLELSIVIEELGVELDDADLETLTSPAEAFRAYTKQVTTTDHPPMEDV